MRKLIAISGFLFSLLLVCCKSVYFTPKEADVVRMESRWKEYNFTQLKYGHSLYLSKCSVCHGLYKPGLYTEAEWMKFLPEMAARAKIDSVEQELILRYLMTMRQANSLNTNNTPDSK